MRATISPVAAGLYIEACKILFGKTVNGLRQEIVFQCGLPCLTPGHTRNSRWGNTPARNSVGGTTVNKCVVFPARLPQRSRADAVLRKHLFLSPPPIEFKLSAAEIAREARENQ